MTDDRETSIHRPVDLVGPPAAPQRPTDDVLSAVDPGPPDELVLYVAARARLDTAVAAWNQRVGATQPPSR